MTRYVDDLIEYQYEYVEKLNKAGNGKEAAMAIDEYVDTMISFAKKWKKLVEKYPELKQQNPPPELEIQMKRMDDTIKIVESKVSTPLNRYILEPPVLKAFQRMTERLNNLELNTVNNKR